MAVPKSFKGTGIREYASAVQRLIAMASELESGQCRAEGVRNGEWTDMSLVQAAELRQSADYLADVLNKLLSYTAG